ncbi:hypothetical protein RMAECT_1358 [Rickettsia rhipicephali str. Ect]|uniref:Uncharacterized protein n=1 Tax=Rickettsia rhipicephali str. Ect TaxID=1359199 RepID=A0A0F3PK49_RICRH|nr:hypothetical protein RMAECT_1358 [Rickettsia rhipicephali str. Ect]
MDSRLRGNDINDPFRQRLQVSEDDILLNLKGNKMTKTVVKNFQH